MDQLDSTGLTPDPNAAPPPDGTQPPEQSQWFLEAPTGTKYRTADDAVAGIAHKDQYISELKEQVATLRELALRNGGTNVQQAPANGTAAQQQSAVEAEIAALKQELFNSGFDTEPVDKMAPAFMRIAQLARKEAESAYESRLKAQEQFELQRLAQTSPAYSMKDPFFAQAYYENGWASPQEVARISDEMRNAYFHGNAPPPPATPRPQPPDRFGRFSQQAASQAGNLTGGGPSPASASRIDANDPNVQAALRIWESTVGSKVASDPNERAKAMQSAIASFSRTPVNG